MKRFRILLTILLIFVAFSANANYLVKTIYIKPNNVQNVPFDKIRGWMDDVQQLYIEEMSKYGYGDKTFKYEREHNGNIKVNVINTNRPSHIYQSNTWENIEPEIPERFKDQKNVHVFIVGGIDTINLNRGCCQWGVGWPIYNFNFGGSCIVAENANTSMVRLITHEVGHTFSLYHTGTANTIMGSGEELLEYEARWLDKHYFFNPDRIIKWQHPKVNQVFNVEEIKDNIISIKINITSPNDLYQIVVMDNDILVLGWQYIDGKNTNRHYNDLVASLVNLCYSNYNLINGGFLIIVFEDIKDKADTLLSLTGYTLEEFTKLLPHFSKCFLAYMETHTLDGKPRIKRRYKPYKNSCFASHEDMLLFILIYLHEAPKQVLFGTLFGMAQPLANKWIHLLLPILNTALAELEELPSRETVPTSMCDTCEVSSQSQDKAYFFS